MTMFKWSQINRIDPLFLKAVRQMHLIGALSLFGGGYLLLVMVTV